MKKLITFFILTLFLAFQSKDNVKKQEKDLILEKILLKFPNLNKDSGINFYRFKSLINYYKDGDAYFYRSDINKSGQENLFISFEVFETKDSILKLVDFTKSYSDSSKRHFLRKKNDRDTLYYFTISNYTGFRKFIKGKYNYYNINSEFTTEQSELFEKHKDSLSKVKGNVRLFKGM